MTATTVGPAATGSLDRDGGCIASATRHVPRVDARRWAGAPDRPRSRSRARRPRGGYWILLADGQVVAFGDAKPWGQPATTHAKAVSLTPMP